MDKLNLTLEYFMTQMTQKEWEAHTKIINSDFAPNTIKPVQEEAFQMYVECVPEVRE